MGVPYEDELWWDLADARQKIEQLEAEVERLRPLAVQFHPDVEEDPLVFVDDDEPVPFAVVTDPEERRRLSTKASDGQTCMIYRGGA